MPYRPVPAFPPFSRQPRAWLIALVLVAFLWWIASPAGLAQSGSPSPSAAPSPSPPLLTKEAALRAIDNFIADPTGERALAAMAAFTRFGQISKEVTIEISPEVTPWIVDKSDPQAVVRSRLVAAYIAGNMRAQLQRGVAQDDPLAGWLQTIETYKRMQAANKELKIPEIESLISEQRAGALQARAQNMTKPGK